MIVPYLSLHFLATGSVKQGFHMNWTVVLEPCSSVTNTSANTLKHGFRSPLSVLQTYPSPCCQLLYHNLLFSQCSSIVSCLRDNSVWCFLKPRKKLWCYPGLFWKGCFFGSSLTSISSTMFPLVYFSNHAENLSCMTWTLSNGYPVNKPGGLSSI